MKLSQIAELTGNDLWKAIQGIRDARHLDWLEKRFPTDSAKLDFIAARRMEIHNQLPLATQIVRNIDFIVSKSTGCTIEEASEALWALHARAEARRESEAS